MPNYLKSRAAAAICILREMPLLLSIQVSAYEPQQNHVPVKQEQLPIVSYNYPLKRPLKRLKQKG